MDTPSDSDEPSVPQQLLVITSQTLSGGRFRPSDWTDRLQSAISVFSDQDACVDMVHIVNFESQRCLMVDPSLSEVEPRLFRFLTRFADDNKLVTKKINKREWVEQHEEILADNVDSLKQAFSF